MELLTRVMATTIPPWEILFEEYFPIVTIMEAETPTSLPPLPTGQQERISLLHHPLPAHHQVQGAVGAAALEVAVVEAAAVLEAGHPEVTKPFINE
jgi:hypothetical protein